MAQDETEDPALDAFVEAEVQRALAPYRKAFPAPVLGAMEDELKCFAFTHPVPYRLLQRLRPRSLQAVSGEADVRGAGAEASASAADAAKKNETG